MIFFMSSNFQVEIQWKSISRYSSLPAHPFPAGNCLGLIRVHTAPMRDICRVLEAVSAQDFSF